MLNAPFVFTQSGPLWTRDVAKEAKRRDVALDVQTLGRLHASGDLSPLLFVGDHVTGPVIEVPVRSHWNTHVIDIQTGMVEGRVIDPALDRIGMQDRTWAEPLVFSETDPDAESGSRPRVRGQRWWWNGLVYSRWQLLFADRLRARIQDLGNREGRASGHSHANDEWDQIRLEQAARDRDLAILLTAIDARYLPDIHQGWRNVTGSDFDEWLDWAELFDPRSVLEACGFDATRVEIEADRLLRHAKWIDPAGAWSDLMSRASPQAWKTLTGDLLTAVELRCAAEILLLCREHLADFTPGPSVLDSSGTRFEGRMSTTPPLDETLARFGLSPHPGAVLVVEGETELYFARQILAHLHVTDSPDRIHVMMMRGGSKPLELLAAGMCAPLVGNKISESSYQLLRPPTALVVAVDPDEGWERDDLAESKRKKLVRRIQDTVLFQAPDAAVAPLDSLVTVTRWEGGTFELAHFTDAEILAAVTALHTRPQHRSSDDEILTRLARARAARPRNGDVKAVWEGWDYQPSKRDLATVLWPVLARKIDAALEAGSDLPPIAAVVHEASMLAARFARGTWSI